MILEVTMIFVDLRIEIQGKFQADKTMKSRSQIRWFWDQGSLNLGTPKKEKAVLFPSNIPGWTIKKMATSPIFKRLRSQNLR